MPASHFQQAVRAFVRALLTLARVYNLALVVNRDTPENELLKAYKKVALKAHPDKGGSAEHFRNLQEAREEWDTQRKKERPNRWLRIAQGSFEAFVSRWLHGRARQLTTKHLSAATSGRESRRVQPRVLSPRRVQSFFV